MADGINEFSKTASSFARNPLGIIALFIVLIYGFAALVTTSSSLAPSEKIPLIYFLVIFPFIILAVFAWLVGFRASSLFAPSDFKDEANYVKMQLSAVASLTAAATKNNTSQSETAIERIVETVQYSARNSLTQSTGWHKQILWVDDRPENNVYERQAFEAVGFKFSLALSTEEALSQLKQRKFAAIISDMGRAEGPREGYMLLDALRNGGDRTPFFIYAESSSQEHRAETAQHGGQGCTNNPEDLFQLVTKAIISREVS